VIYIPKRCLIFLDWNNIGIIIIITMRIFLVAYFVEPPQDLVPYAQRVVRVMGAAALSRVQVWKWFEIIPCPRLHVLACAAPTSRLMHNRQETCLVLYICMWPSVLHCAPLTSSSVSVPITSDFSQSSGCFVFCPTVLIRGGFSYRRYRRPPRAPFRGGRKKNASSKKKKRFFLRPHLYLQPIFWHLKNKSNIRVKWAKNRKRKG